MTFPRPSSPLLPWICSLGVRPTPTASGVSQVPRPGHSPGVVSGSVSQAQPTLVARAKAHGCRAATNQRNPMSTCEEKKICLGAGAPTTSPATTTSSMCSSARRRHPASDALFGIGIPIPAAIAGCFFASLRCGFVLPGVNTGRFFCECSYPSHSWLRLAARVLPGVPQ